MKKIFVLGLIFVLSVVLVGCGNNNKEEKKPEKKQEEVKANTNEGVIKDRVVGVLELTNTSLIFKDDNSTLTTTVTNKTENDVVVDIFNIIFYDKDDNEVVRTIGYVGGVVPAGKSREIINNVNQDLSHVTRVEYEIVE